MLVGSGGVVALVLGAWSVLWVVRVAPERGPVDWYPVASAFAAAMFAFSLLEAQSDVVLGLLDWFHADPSERAEQVVTTLSYSLRPLLGAILGSLALVVAALAASWSVEPTDDRSNGWPAQIGVGGLALLTAFGLVDLLAMRRAFERLVDSLESQSVAVEHLQLESSIGAALALTTLVLAVALAVHHTWQRRQT